VGKFGFGQINRRGEKLMEFSEANRLFMFNTAFKKQLQRKWTWKIPNGTKNETAYVLTNNREILQDVFVLSSFKT